jgi:hypothetical protein
MEAKGFGCTDFLIPRTIAAGLDGDVVAGEGEGLEVGPPLDELSSSSSSSSLLLCALLDVAEAVIRSPSALYLWDCFFWGCCSCN